MFPYLFVFTLCLVLNTYSSRKRWWPILLSCLLLAFLAGFRDISIGSDTDGYPHYYISAVRFISSIKDIINLETDLDKGFLFLYWIASWLGDQYWIGLFLVELLISVFTFWGYYRLSKHFGNSIFIFTFAFLFLIYNYTLNAMRQECAISISFLAFSYLWEKKWIPYVLWTLVAYTFHSSAIMSLMIPFFLAISGIRDSKKRTIVIAFTLVLMVLAVASFWRILNDIGDMALFNEAYASRYGEGGAFESESRVAYTPLLVSSVIYYAMVLAYKKRIVSRHQFYFHFMLNTAYVLCQFLTMYSMFLHRLGLYFFIVTLYFYSVEVSSKRMSSPLMRYLSIVLFCAYWVLDFVIKNKSETIPYASKILGID